MLGYKEETDPNSLNEVYQDFFTKGLLPQLRSRVQYLLPDNLNSAVSKAMHAEHKLGWGQVQEKCRFLDHLSNQLNKGRASY